MTRSPQKPTPDQEIDDSVLSTMQINTEPYRTKKNPNRIDSFKYALAGLLYMLRHESSVRSIALATFVTFALGLWLRVDTMSWAMLLVSAGVVWMAEFINSAVEAVVDLATQDIHPMAKVAKDVASAAVLVGNLIMLGVSALVLLPPLLDRLSG